MPILIAANHFLGVERPGKTFFRAIVYTEAVIERAVPATGTIPAKAAGFQRIDMHFNGHAGACACYGDGASEGMAFIQFRIAGCKLFAVVAVGEGRLYAPGGIKSAEADRVAGVDGEDGRQVSGKVAVQGGAVEGDVMEHGVILR
jgi:hypothetical protein